MPKSITEAKIITTGEALHVAVLGNTIYLRIGPPEVAGPRTQRLSQGTAQDIINALALAIKEVAHV